jgi:hypothetical protein
MVVCIPSWCRGREVKFSPHFRVTDDALPPGSLPLGDPGGPPIPKPQPRYATPSRPLPPPAVAAPVPPKAEGYGGASGRALEQRSMVMGGPGGPWRSHRGEGELRTRQAIVVGGVL